MVVVGDRRRADRERHGRATTGDRRRQVAGVGARHNQVLDAQSNALRIKNELTGHLSAVEDADLAASIVELQMQEVAYKAALGATSRVLQPTLMDFLR